MAKAKRDAGHGSLSLGPTLPYKMGRFTLCREIGAGGMATVYLSKMRLAAGIERLVAVKTIHSHLAKEQTFLDMFLDEAKIASHISHPNVCAVYDFGDVGGIYYISMEYLVGEPLIDFVNEIVTQRDDDILEAVPFLAARIIADAAEGLHAAHTLRGSDGQPLHVVHRDVSPQNIFVTYEGSVKVVDFGCAKALERVTQTNTGIMKGKVSYASPEQLQGGEVDARLDVFALGVCLWEALTLRQLFRRENAIMTAKAVLEDDIPRADEEAEWVPKELADICEKALQRDAEKRFGSAREMGRALRSFIAGAGTTFESAEVAEWMAALFPDRHTATLRRLSEVKALDVSMVGPVPGGDDDDDDDPAAIADAPTKLAKTQSSAARQNVWELSQPEDLDPVVLPTRSRAWITALVILALLVGAGAYAWFGQRAAVEEALGIGTEPATEEIAAPPDDSITDVEPAVPDDAPDEATPEEAPEASPDEATPDVEEGSPDEAPTEEASSGRRRRGSSEEASSSRRSRRGSSETTTESAEPAEAAAPAEGGEPENVVRPTATLDFSQGAVSVRTTAGWAMVFHGSRRLGRTPLRVNLPVGEQRLRILPMGEEPAREVTVTVEWGATAQIRVPIDESSFGNPY